MSDLAAVLNSSAQRLLHKNVMGPWVIDDVHEDLKVGHVWCGHNHHITDPTLQQLSVT